MKRLIFLLFLTPIFAFAQSGWVKAPGDWYAQVNISGLISDNYFNLDGNELNTNELSQYSLNFYGEYGLNKRFTAIGAISALRSNAFNTTDAVIAPGDLRLEIKYGIFQGKFPLSISVASEIPLSNETNFATAKQPNDFGFRDQINLATTDGEVNFWTTLALSHSLSRKAYVSVFGAYNIRTENFTDQIKGGLEFGYQPLERLWLIGKLNALGSASAEANPNVPFIRGEGTSFTAHSLGVSYEFLKGLGFSAEYFGYSNLVIERKNLYSGPIFSVGVFLKRS